MCWEKRARIVSHNSNCTQGLGDTRDVLGKTRKHRAAIIIRETGEMGFRVLCPSIKVRRDC